MIGMYAHHSGSGHLHRVRAIREHLTDTAEILSSAPGADVPLPLDVGEPPVDPEAGGTLHWAPTNVEGLTTRMAAVAEWIDRNRPSVFYVDVSVEIAAFVRLMGVPVVTLAMPGLRDDPAHQLGYGLAIAIIAAWPDWVPLPEHLRAHAERVHAVGGISRLTPTPGVERTDETVILRGAGGDDFAGRQWPRALILGGENHVDDPTPYLERAGLVIAAAGQNSVADLAATGAPAILLPQDRPFDEQHATVRVLREAGIAVVPESFPEPADWAELSALARSRASNWSQWQTQGSAQRAAAVIEEAAS